jgi:hypothetical protein
MHLTANPAVRRLVWSLLPAFSRMLRDVVRSSGAKPN